MQTNANGFYLEKQTDPNTSAEINYHFTLLNGKRLCETIACVKRSCPESSHKNNLRPIGDSLAVRVEIN